jgi:tripartite-type tricarboxylate transporter receptor subunit TctC
MRKILAMLAAAGLVAGLGILGTAAQAEPGYPNRTVTIIVPFPAGGATDALGRFVAQELSKRHSHQFIIDNRSGANGGTGIQAAVDAKPDGYTLLYATSGSLLVNPSIYPSLKYNASRDLTPIGEVAMLSSVTMISNKLAKEHDIKTMQDLVAYAKANPDKLNFGSGGIGNGSHIGGELLKAGAGIKMVHIPFQGGAASSLALTAGDIDVLSSTMPEALPLIKAGNAVPLAVMSKERLAALPNIPTVGETGIQGAETNTWHGLFGPAKLPKDIVEVLEKDLKEILATKEAKALFDNLSTEILIGSADDLGKLVVSDQSRLDALLKATGISLKK